VCHFGALAFAGLFAGRGEQDSRQPQRPITVSPSWEELK
jgi:hypothetical protein